MKKFYEYTDYDGYPLINELTYPHHNSTDEDAFLIYASNRKEAFKLAMEHLYESKKLEKFYGTYNGERYENIMCVME